MVAAWQLKISGSPPNEQLSRPQPGVGAPRGCERRCAAVAKGHLMRSPVFFPTSAEGEGVPATSRQCPPHALLAGTRAPGVASSWDDRLAGRVGAEGARSARGSAPQALAAAVFPPFVAEIREIIPEMAFSRGILGADGAQATGSPWQRASGLRRRFGALRALGH